MIVQKQEQQQLQLRKPIEKGATNKRCTLFLERRKNNAKKANQ